MSEDTFDCTGYEDDSFHPIYDGIDCRQYWHCIYVGTNYMRAVKRVCPAGASFDILSKECELSSIVDCVHTKSINSTSRISTKSYTTYITRKTSTSSPRTTNLLIQSSKVLSQTTSISPIEQLIKILNAMTQNSKNQTTLHTTTMRSKVNLTTTLSTSTVSLTTKRDLVTIDNRRRYIILNVLTSNEHKIHQFTINKTRGILINCNEIRRRQLRDLILRIRITSTTTKVLKIFNSSSNINPHDILSLNIFIMSFLFLQKISD